MTFTVRPLGPEPVLSFVPAAPVGPVSGPRCAAWTTAAAGAEMDRPVGGNGVDGRDGERDWALLRALRRGGGPEDCHRPYPVSSVTGFFAARTASGHNAVSSYRAGAFSGRSAERGLCSSRSKLPKCPEKFRPPARSKGPEPRLRLPSRAAPRPSRNSSGLTGPKSPRAPDWRRSSALVDSPRRPGPLQAGMWRLTGPHPSFPAPPLHQPPPACS